MKKLLALAVLMLSISFSALSQELDTISTVRPSISEGYEVVGNGIIQFENGIAGRNNRNEFDLNTMLRAGIHKRVELRALVSATSTNPRRGDIFNFGTPERIPLPLELSSKLLFRENEGYLPGVSSVLAYNVNDATITAFLTAAGSFLKDWSYTANVGLAPTDRDRMQGFYVFALGRSIGERFNVFGEFAQPDKSSWAVDAGMTYLINRNWQCDVYAGRETENLRPQVNNTRYFAGAGIAFRLD